MKFKIKTLNKTKNIELQNYRTIDSTLVLFMFISFNLSFSLFTNDYTRSESITISYKQIRLIVA